MGNRLSKIYTKTGDDGTTGLGDGSRVQKFDARLEAIGDIDELNCCVGMLLSNDLSEEIAEFLLLIQNNLFDLGGELSIPESCLLKLDSTKQVEAQIDKLNAKLPPLKEFVLPGGDVATSHAHLCRSVCRRAERHLVKLQSEENVRVEATEYLNRLSDYFFVLARTLFSKTSGSEVMWDHSKH